MWPYEESDDYGFVQGIFSMMRALFSDDFDATIYNQSVKPVQVSQFFSI